jgi:nucleoid-associated protein YgaU
VALRGIARVQAGDTLWSIACRWYSGPLLPGANPLTHCTCWPGIAEHNQIEPPQLIGVGWLVQVPVECRQ